MINISEGWKNWLKSGPIDKLVQFMAFVIIILWVSYKHEYDSNVEYLHQQNLALQKENRELRQQVLDCDTKWVTKIEDERATVINYMFEKFFELDSVKNNRKLRK